MQNKYIVSNTYKYTTHIKTYSYTLQKKHNMLTHYHNIPEHQQDKQTIQETAPSINTTDVSLTCRILAQPKTQILLSYLHKVDT